MDVKTITAIVLGSAMLVATSGSGFAQTPGNGNTGNPGTNNPAVIQKDSAGMMKGMTGAMMDGKTAKHGKDCGIKGENQGTAKVDSNKNCE